MAGVRLDEAQSVRLKPDPQELRNDNRGRIACAGPPTVMLPSHPARMLVGIPR